MDDTASAYLSLIHNPRPDTVAYVLLDDQQTGGEGF
jgi:hypothetical protein